jgi:hypothetical protein
MAAALRSHVTVPNAVGALPGRGTDDAIRRDAEGARQRLDKAAGNGDERSTGAAPDAGDSIGRGVEDVDGR